MPISSLSSSCCWLAICTALIEGVWVLVGWDAQDTEKGKKIGGSGFSTL
jgi:hypothetical protein